MAGMAIALCSTERTRTVQCTVWVWPKRYAVQYGWGLDGTTYGTGMTVWRASNPGGSRVYNSSIN